MGQSIHFWLMAYKPTNSQTSLANSISRLEARYGVLDFTYLLLCSLHTSYHSSLTWHVSVSLLHRSPLATYVRVGQLRTASTGRSNSYDTILAMHASHFGNRALCKKNLRIVNLMTHVLQIPNYQIDAVMSIALPTCWVHCQDAPTYATFDRRESLTDH